MSDLPLDALLANQRVHVVQTPAPVVEIPSQAEAVSPPVPSEDHVAAVDGAFIREQQEHETIAGLLGLRLSLLLMHDLAKDAMPAGKDEDEAKTKPREDDSQPGD
jgi:hypothetical protein